MNKIRIIDLLNKIANGEEIKAKLKFKLGDIIITYYGTNNYYKTPEYNIEYIDKGCTTHDFNLGMIIKHLNDEVEILEEEKKIPEKLKEIEKEHKNCTRKHWQQKCAEHYANEMIYKQRNEKSLEYINNLLKSDDIPLVDVILTTIKEKLGGDEE